MAIKMNKYFSIILLLVFCAVIYAGCGNRYVPPRYIVIADEISEAVEAKMIERYKKYQLTVIGDVGGMAGGVNLIGLSFRVTGPLTKEELRVIYVDSVEMFLYELNGNEEIRPFLKKYPYTIDGVDNTIFVFDKNGGKLFYPNISIVGTVRGMVKYITNDKENQYKYKTEEKESYGEALKLVREDKQS
jgi:hypothetical protein